MNLAALLGASLLLLPGSHGEPCGPDPEPYIRLVEDERGLRLELASRVFMDAREGAPLTTVTLVGAMHIAQPLFYARTQAALDLHDLVLFEQVREELPWGELEGLSPTDLDHVLSTGRRMEALLQAAQHRDSVSTFALGDPPRQRMTASRFERASTDAWGRPMELSVERKEGRLVRYTARSLGRDGEPGGEGVDADRQLDLEVRAGDPALRALQSDLAEVLGWRFQLDEIDELGVRWRNSDLSMAELRRALGGGDGQAREFARFLEGGGGALDELVRGGLRLLGASATIRETLQLTVIEVLARSEELFEVPPIGLGDLFEVIIEDRNRVVLDDLAGILEGEPEAHSIGVFYGAGHLRELERGLVSELGLSAIRTRWIPAVELQWQSLSLSKQEIELIRVSIRETFEVGLGGR